jgi:hypothetical protein
MKDKIGFDTTDAGTILDSDSVGAYVRSADGTLITHTTVSGKEALDVNIVEGINVEVDLSHVDDSVRLGDGTDLTTTTTIGSDVGLDVNVIGSPALSNISILTTKFNLATSGTAEKVVDSNLSGRKHLMVYNNDNKRIFIGTSGTDLLDQGFPVSPGSYIELKAGDAIDVYFDSSKDAHEIRTLELS